MNIKLIPLIILTLIAINSVEGQDITKSVFTTKDMVTFENDDAGDFLEDGTVVSFSNLCKEFLSMMPSDAKTIGNNKAYIHGSTIYHDTDKGTKVYFYVISIHRVLSRTVVVTQKLHQYGYNQKTRQITESKRLLDELEEAVEYSSYSADGIKADMTSFLKKNLQ